MALAYILSHFFKVIVIISHRGNIFCIYFMCSEWIGDRYNDMSRSYGKKTTGTYQRADCDWTSLHRRYEASTRGICFIFFLKFSTLFFYIKLTCIFSMYEYILPFIWRFFNLEIKDRNLETGWRFRVQSSVYSYLSLDTTAVV